MYYQKPNMEIKEFQGHDVVCTSLLNGHDNGDGDSGSINDWL